MIINWTVKLFFSPRMVFSIKNVFWNRQLERESGGWACRDVLRSGSSIPGFLGWLSATLVPLASFACALLHANDTDKAAAVTCKQPQPQPDSWHAETRSCVAPTRTIRRREFNIFVQKHRFWKYVSSHVKWHMIAWNAFLKGLIFSLFRSSRLSTLITIPLCEPPMCEDPRNASGLSKPVMKFFIWISGIIHFFSQMALCC